MSYERFPVSWFCFLEYYATIHKFLEVFRLKFDSFRSFRIPIIFIEVVDITSLFLRYYYIGSSSITFMANSSLGM